ncbi:unnamed protein product [Rotaria sordida]|uniref:EF-hand domain-containing protein n=1 Tax=Rotaria sordida TaxID=392033 RepID=A0A814I709_9BILA|nr:unnamed protein product [Rotaria sordida]
MDKRRTRKQRNTMSLTQKELNMLRKTSHLSDKEIRLWNEEFLRKYPTDVNHDDAIDFNEFLFLAAVTARASNLDERLEMVFDLWDVSNDGLLDQNELGHLISAMYDRARVTDRQGEKDPHRRAKEIITKLDITGDKKLSKDEFIKGCKNDEVVRKLLLPDT